jgi:tRNA uridine 5-carboxymethylaminomethyl modification enzyme
MSISLRTDPDHPYDVIVCGAGHAGCEAALAATRLGAEVLLLTGNLDTIAQMSCNPAIGGQAKGQIVREIDALGGEMALNTDFTAIQFKLLNTSKGPSVQAPRAQCDKKAYQARMKHVLEQNNNICIFQALVDGLIIKNGRCEGIRTTLDLTFYGKTVIVTTGTFLRALMHVGQNQSEGGRLGDHVAKGLSADFLKAGIELGRFKTGTPPRLLGHTINFDKTEIQEGDANPTKFAFYDTRTEEETFHVERNSRWFHVEHALSLPGSKQVTCRITRTNKNTASIIRENLHLSPLYKGDIVGAGPRYCPSIEDKIVRFSDKDSHQVYLEPEGRNTDEWYVNGLSTSLPFDVQMKVLHSIKGLEEAVIMRPAYAVEYDYAHPTQLSRTLESQKIESLFFAGQINGTSGYEEAAAQGLIAGANAALQSTNQKPLLIGRDIGYIGVLIDDLVTKGTTEPYRMFTSRAEHRLLFNHGSAELRYLDIIEGFSLLSESRKLAIQKKSLQIQKWLSCFNTQKVEANDSYADQIRKNQSFGNFPSDFDNLNQATKDEVIYRIKYEGYMLREFKSVQKLRDSEKIKIPTGFSYSNIPGLKSECAEKLAMVRPETLGQASRIAGVDPSAISVLMIMIKKDLGNSKKRNA